MNATLRNLLSEMRSEDPTSSFVFCSPTGVQLRERSLLNVCKRIAMRAGLTSRAFLHKFRHTFATHLVQQGRTLESIKALLGHSTIRETEIYAHNKSDHLHEEVRVLDDLSY